jgi:hypothetical protein
MAFFRTSPKPPLSLGEVIPPPIEFGSNPVGIVVRGPGPRIIPLISLSPQGCALVLEI